MSYLFSSRQVGNVLPTLLGRHDTKLDAFGEWVHAVHEFQFCVTTEGDHLQGIGILSTALLGIPGITSPLLTWYISFSLLLIALKPVMKPSSRAFRRSS